MKFVGETRTISKPSAARWALLFMGASRGASGAKAHEGVGAMMSHLKVRPTKQDGNSASGAEAHEGVGAMMSHLKVRPTKQDGNSASGAKAGFDRAPATAPLPSTALRARKPYPDGTPVMRFIQAKSYAKCVHDKPFEFAQGKPIEIAQGKPFAKCVQGKEAQ
jgi:hypothetical protein